VGSSYVSGGKFFLCFARVCVHHRFVSITFSHRVHPGHSLDFFVYNSCGHSGSSQLPVPGSPAELKPPNHPMIHSALIRPVARHEFAGVAMAPVRAIMPEDSAEISPHASRSLKLAASRRAMRPRKAALKIPSPSTFSRHKDMG